MSDSLRDSTLGFLIDAGLTRGQSVRLSATLDTMISQHAYPEKVGEFLAESAALTALLASTVKYDGVFTLQVRSSGPIQTLVVQETADGKMRGYARYDEAALTAATSNADGKENPVAHYFGNGVLTFTTEKGTETYQGVVGLDKTTLSECVCDYFRQSEQIESDIRLSVKAPDETNGWRVGAILLQKMPFDKKIVALMNSADGDELWNTADILLKSATPAELTDPLIGHEELLYRLFHQNDLHFFTPKNVDFGCRCSKEKVLEMLRHFSKQDRKDMIQDGIIKVDCQFCGKSYTLTLKDLGE